jgi:hypothetical protein
MTRLLFRLLRAHRNVKAAARGRIVQRVWNRGVRRVGWRLLRKLYR